MQGPGYVKFIQGATRGAHVKAHFRGWITASGGTWFAVGSVSCCLPNDGLRSYIHVYPAGFEAATLTGLASANNRVLTVYMARLAAAKMSSLELVNPQEGCCAAGLPWQFACSSMLWK
jgi:hypothetical protein